MTQENSFAKSYNHLEVEKKWLDQWLADDIYKTKIDKSKESFSIALPPPNVTGELHMGHALGGTIQDVLIRYNRMLGKNVLWQIGTDHAGIGTQIVVEKHLKKTEHKRKEDIGREEFTKRSIAWKDEYGGKILEQMKTLGFSPDYSRARYTMDEHYVNAVQDAFIEYFNRGLVYRGKRIVNWCPKCKTSLSDLEIDKEAVAKKLYEIKYFLEDSSDALVVATTRPETMFGDVAVAINPDDERFKDLIEKIKANPASVKVKIPFTAKLIPVILDEHVKTDFGTGALKVTPAHDANDFDIAKRHGLEPVIIMDDSAQMMNCAEVPQFVTYYTEDGEESIELYGLDRYEARKAVVKALRDDLLQTSEYDQEKDLHDRCGTEIEPYLSDQWYVDMKELAKMALEAESSGDTKFVPERYNVIFKTWLENIQDWCISRQIWWGHRIPVFYYEEAGELKFYAAKEPKDPSHKQDEDVLDTWFSSALWPFVTMQDDKEIFETFYPTSILATAREIINLWVSRMIFSSKFFENKVPFEASLIHPVIQTPDGKRMSKSKGNAINPLEMVEKYGSDASRMWYASVSLYSNQDVKFPGRKDKKQGWTSDTFEQYRKFCNKLFNASKFVMQRIQDSGVALTESSELDESKFNIADRWILNKFTNVLKNIETAFQSYDLAKVQKEIYEFLWFDYCDWYLELTKIEGDKETQNKVLYYILENSLKALHPIMPFITEEIWQSIKQRSQSICFESYPEANEKYFDNTDASKKLEFVTEIISSLRNSRQSLSIAWSSEIAVFYETNNEFESNALAETKDYIIKLLKLSKLEKLDSEPAKPNNVTLLRDTKVVIPLEGLVDLDKLKASLTNKISKIAKDMNVLEQRLSSENFVNNAKPEKIQETKEALEQFQSEKNIFEEELSSIS